MWIQQIADSCRSHPKYLNLIVSTTFKGICPESESKCFTSTETCLNMLSLHSSLCPGQLQSLVCVKKYVKVCTGVLVTQTYIQLHVGKFKRSIQKVPPVFEREQEEQNSFCRSSPAKCMSCVSSFQLCYLSYWGFLSIVKLLGLNNVQFYIFIYTVCVNRVDQRRGNWISGNEILCSVKVKWFRVYSQYYQFKQCTSEIKVLNSTLSFDYKHMSGALRLTPPPNNPGRAWTRWFLR